MIRVVLSKLRGHLWVGELGRNGPKARLQFSAAASLCKKVAPDASMQTPCRTTSGGRTLPNALFTNYCVFKPQVFSPLFSRSGICSAVHVFVHPVYGSLLDCSSLVALRKICLFL